MRKIQIAHLQVLPILSGVQNSMLNIITRLDPNKYDITVVCQTEGDLTNVLVQKGMRYIILPELRREINPYFDALAFFKLYKLFKSQNYAIVHTHSSKPGILGRLAAKAAGVTRIVHTVHGFAFHELSSRLRIFLVAFLERIAAMVTDRVIFLNNKDRMIASELKIVSGYKMINIPNGIDSTVFVSKNGRVQKEKLVGTEANTYIVAMIARPWEQKAPQYFIRSIPAVAKEFPKAKFWMIGDGPLRNDLENLSQKLGIQKSIFFLGWRNDVVELLKMIDVFVLPSLWEGLPISILEAMAASKPVVATNIKGNNELVVHGRTGFLVEPKNPEQISKYVLKLLRNRPLARYMGQQGKLRVKRHFDINKTVQKIDDLYSMLLKEKNGVHENESEKQINERQFV